MKLRGVKDGDTNVGMELFLKVPCSKGEEPISGQSLQKKAEQIPHVLGEEDMIQVLACQRTIPELHRGKYIFFWKGAKKMVPFIYWDAQRQEWKKGSRRIKGNFWFMDSPTAAGGSFMLSCEL